ncbi:MAG: hypothetical protein WBM25_06525 [Azonexus sp.]
MDISDAPKAAETKSRRENEDFASTANAKTCLLSSIASSLILCIQKQKERHTRAPCGSSDGRPCPVCRLSPNTCPAAIDRAMYELSQWSCQPSQKELSLF